MRQSFQLQQSHPNDKAPAELPQFSQNKESQSSKSSHQYQPCTRILVNNRKASIELRFCTEQKISIKIAHSSHFMRKVTVNGSCWCLGNNVSFRNANTN